MARCFPAILLVCGAAIRCVALLLAQAPATYRPVPGDPDPPHFTANGQPYFLRDHDRQEGRSQLLGLAEADFVQRLVAILRSGGGLP